MLGKGGCGGGGGGGGGGQAPRRGKVVLSTGKAKSDLDFLTLTSTARPRAVLS